MASDLPAFKDFMMNNVEGKLFQAGNPESLASALLEIFSDFEVYKKFGQNSLDTAKEFLWEKRGEDMLKMIDL
jgi:glycosyltransferase involved in cell wall biosynthesis